MEESPPLPDQSTLEFNFNGLIVLFGPTTRSSPRLELESRRKSALTGVLPPRQSISSTGNGDDALALQATKAEIRQISLADQIVALKGLCSQADYLLR
eukprot:5065825-Amphidinium_carterae.1